MLDHAQIAERTRFPDKTSIAHAGRLHYADSQQLAQACARNNSLIGSPKGKMGIGRPRWSGKAFS